MYGSRIISIRLNAVPLRSDSTWHGFKNIDNEHMYLDPIKVTLLTPGMEKDGTMSDFGIPYQHRGEIPRRTWHRC